MQSVDVSLVDEFSVIEFDTEFYLMANSDVKNAGVDPLLHYINYGCKENRSYRSIYNLEKLIPDFLASRLTMAEFCESVDISRYLKNAQLSHCETLESFLSNFSGESNRYENYLHFKPNLHPYVFEVASTNEKRITMIVPSLQGKNIFGGIATALDFFKWLISIVDESWNFRLISQDTPVDESCLSYFLENGFVLADISDNLPRSICDGSKRDVVPTSLQKNEIFVTTFWATAFSVQKGLDQYPEFEGGICNFLQDYEPNFYPASERYVLSQQTLIDKRNKLYLINSETLFEYCKRQIHLSGHGIFFVPRINRFLRTKSSNLTRKNYLLFYARKNPRNLFEIGVIALKELVNSYPSVASKFDFFGIGDIAENFKISNDIEVHCLGKLSLAEYRRWMSISKVGLSLMASPHPSYPPLEMAFNGLRVVTNDFSTKKMGDVHDNLFSSEVPDPSLLAALLAEQCLRSEESDNISGLPFRGHLTGFGDLTSPFDKFLADEHFLSFFQL